MSNQNNLWDNDKKHLMYEIKLSHVGFKTNNGLIARYVLLHNYLYSLSSKILQAQLT